MEETSRRGTGRLYRESDFFLPILQAITWLNICCFTLRMTLLSLPSTHVHADEDKRSCLRTIDRARSAQQVAGNGRGAEEQSRLLYAGMALTSDRLRTRPLNSGLSTDSDRLLKASSHVPHSGNMKPLVIKEGFMTADGSSAFFIQ